MTLERITSLTKDLIKINSYETKGKIKIINYIKTILEKETWANITILEGDEPLLIAHLKGKNGKYKLLLEGHLDVVSAPSHMFSPILKDNIIYGRGSADMKGGCVSILTAFIQASKKSNLEGDLYLVFTTDEEYSGERIKFALENNYIPKVDFALIPEPTNCDIYNSHKGETWLEVEFFGKAAHSSIPHLGNNAIYMASSFIEKVKSHIKTYSSYEEYRRPVMSIGTIQGGTSPNSVPDYVKIVIDKRYLPGEDICVSLNEIETILKECRDDDENFSGKVNVLGDWSSLYTEPTSYDFIKIKNIISKELNREININSWSAWGEGGYINKFGIPTIYFGPGDTKVAHTNNECTSLIEVLQVAKIYSSVIQELCF